MDATLTVEFEPPESGWMRFRIAHVDAEFSIVASCVPYDSLGNLIHAISQVAKGLDEVVVPWSVEPGEYDLRFLSESDRTSVSVTSFPDHARVKGSGQLEFEAHDSRLEVCLAFWRALRRLESRITAEDFERGWGHPFQADKLANLTRTMDRMKLERRGGRQTGTC